MNSRFLFVWMASYPFLLTALPQNPHVVSGEVATQILQSGHLEIKTGDRAIVHWGDFSIAPNEKVQFLQPSSKSAILNRVRTKVPSHLLGELVANGKVYLINPNGVIIGKDAVIRTADFLASTLDFSDAEFLAGESLLFQGRSQEAIVNYGTIETPDGHISLVGRVIHNEGSLLAPEGKASLIAGQEILLTLEETPIFHIRPSLTPDGTVAHSGKIEALIADLQAEGKPYTRGMNLEGSVLALNTVEQNGKIYLKADGIAVSPRGTLSAPQGSIEIEAIENGLYIEGSICAKEGSISIQNSSKETPFYNLGSLDVSGSHGGTIEIHTNKLVNAGKILAEGTLSDGGNISIYIQGPYIETVQGKLSADGKKNGGTIILESETSFFSSGTLSSQGESGGEISLFAPQLTLVSAEVNASGSSQGGEIYLGGGIQGQSRGPANAKSTHLSGDTKLLANATQGNGGTIVAWSDEKTICHGSIQANAGLIGDGGFIEVSSLGEFYCGADLGAHAPHGIPGSVLIDPKNLVISSVTGVYPQYEFIDPNAGGGSNFGAVVVALSTGNIVVTKPNDNLAGTNAGAVYLYNGLTAALISTITGSSASDTVGTGGVVALTNNGNFVTRTNNWKNGAATTAGAVTFGNGMTGISGVVSSSNSLVGTQASDTVGNQGITALTNGNYVVASSSWHNGAAANAGAATWGNGTTGISGPVSSSNSLIGTQGSDSVSVNGIVALTNGNYVVRSNNWANGVATQAGAVTWGNGTTGSTGAVSSSNSLVGTQASDQVGSGGVTSLSNGNYVVASTSWDNGATSNVGAATWGNGLTGITGAVSASNSLVGTQVNDFVSNSGVTALTNGNYVVGTGNWHNGAAASAGASTWGNGLTGITGAVSASNSLVGTQASDQVGGQAATALTNGNYVVKSGLWANGGATAAGAATWGNGLTGITGAVSASNSLVGTQTNDRVSNGGVTALTTNGNYVVASSNWHNGAAANAGAATWGNGSTGTVGAVSLANSLVGTQTSDFVSTSGVVALTNGNYVVRSPSWANGAATSAGAATWGNGSTGASGVVSASNSLVGTQSNDEVSFTGLTPLLVNGNYVVISQLWNGGSLSKGAVTWGNGSTGTTGVVSASNSLIGSRGNDQIGNNGVTALVNGNYVIKSNAWQSGPGVNSGAATWGNGTTGITGTISSSNSLVGTQGDSVSNGGVVALADGNYLVRSTSWRNGSLVSAGAATFGNGTTGTTGIVSTLNSLVGTAASSNLGNLQVDSVHGTFIAPFSSEGGKGRVRIGLENLNQTTFALAQAQTMNLHPNTLTATLNAGTNVTLQANNDLTISSPITSSPGAGNLTISSGRSAFVNANITTGNGSLTLVANDLLASGVVNSQRDPGNAVLNIASGVTLNAGTGSLTLSLLNGAGKTNAGSGDITIANNATLMCSGSGAINITAQEHNIAIGNNALLETQNGNLMLTAASGITANGATLMCSGSGAINITAQEQNIAIENNALLETQNGNLMLTAASDITANGATLRCSGSGAINITAQEQNIAIENNALLETQNGNLMLTAGVGITSASTATLRTTGTGQLILVSDALFPTPPAFGSGYVNLPGALLQTNGGKLLIYTSLRELNTLPAAINGVDFVPGPNLINSTTEKWGTYYPNSSGIPFTVFYKLGAGVVIDNVLHSNITALVEPFRDWREADYDPYFCNPFCWKLLNRLNMYCMSFLCADAPSLPEAE